jgi:hypothetical protein
MTFGTLLARTLRADEQRITAACSSMCAAQVEPGPGQLIGLQRDSRCPVPVSKGRNTKQAKTSLPFWRNT